ncbi:restriction endonuclease [Lactobacillus sp.]|uniref:restriction endonuclease n=1 Tax=Lactobacillus sp. TaxID=1591 RepID=UPI0019ADBF53|nr:restriction endonuclease [Lactobacillus sp.]MBD5429145.1 hypothetical protein [Lactobacillus sp.]
MVKDEYTPDDLQNSLLKIIQEFPAISGDTLLDKLEEKLGQKLNNSQKRFLRRNGREAATKLVRDNFLENKNDEYFLTEKGKKQLKRDAEVSDFPLPLVKNKVPVVKNEVHDHSAPYSVSKVKSWINEQNNILREKLLNRLRKVDPGEFETLMVKLISAMGYKGTDGLAVTTQRTRDGGIDGIINKDPLGLERVYLQVKRYAANKTVGRPQINEFVGSLGGEIKRGIFITTSSFSKDARERAEDSDTIALVDGQMLGNLMIQYKVGVQVKENFELYQIDSDFFNNETN